MENPYKAIQDYLRSSQYSPTVLSILTMLSPVPFDIRKHVVSGVDLTKGYKVDVDGPIILVGIRPSVGNGLNYSETYLEVSAQIQCYAATEAKANQVAMSVQSDMHGRHGGKIKLARQETPVQIIPDFNDTGWYIGLWFCFCRILNTSN